MTSDDSGCLLEALIERFGEDYDARKGLLVRFIRINFPGVPSSTSEEDSCLRRILLVS